METITAITAAQIMTRQLVSTSSRTHVLDAIERLLAHGVSGLPVICPAGSLEGRFSERNAISAMDLADITPASGCAAQFRRVTVRQIARPPVTISSQMGVFEAVDLLLRHHISVAAVVNSQQELLGVFSEQSALHVFIGLCWEQMPAAGVTAWMSRDERRIVTPETTLDEVLDRFQQTSFRRLMIVHKDRLTGQISRREALQAALECTRSSVVTARDEAFRQGLPATAQVKSWMNSEVDSVAPEDSVVTVAQQFVSTAARQLPVTENGRLVGQISRSDLLRAVQRCFPQVTSTVPIPRPLYLSSLNRSGTETAALS
ncbi:MAG: CBS domain-containing protein [Planctomycetaceae bacterium]|nr:CBS domain-containing protein [Planctomycetaceae bacterium]